MSDGFVRSAPRAPLPPETPIEQLPEEMVQVELSTPYSMGTTNCWLVVGDDDVLCVDPGGAAEVAASALAAALAPFGRRLEDISTLLVTHTHPDHCGAVAGLAEKTDAAVAVGAPEVDSLAGQSALPDPVMAAWVGLGAPREEAERAARVRPPHAPVDRARIRPLHDGTELRLGGRSWAVHVLAGHSPGHVVLAANDALLVGDQLLANVLPAPHCGPSSAAADHRQDCLPWAPSVADFLASMERFEGGAFETVPVLPGHGGPFRGTARPVERARRYHQVRCQLVASQLAQRGPSSVWALATVMYGGLVSSDGVDRRFGSAAAEVAGRLEALCRAGQARWTRRGDVVLFESA